MRQPKSYSGVLMEKGKVNEAAIIKWLEREGKLVLDLRDFRQAQHIDVDIGIEDHDGIVLAEIKSDEYISETPNEPTPGFKPLRGNLCFENMRINHYARGNWFYKGWGWRSPAKLLIVRNPPTQKTFVFEFEKLRNFVGKWIIKHEEIYKSPIQMTTVMTDDGKTTFNFLIPMSELKKARLYKGPFIVPSIYASDPTLETQTQLPGILA